MRGTIPNLINPHPMVTALPSVYQGNDFTERMLSVFDDQLAPLVATLDSFTAYLDPMLAPADFLPWLAQWVALPLDENWDEQQQRRMIRGATDLLQWRGTARGLIQLLTAYLDIDAEAVTVEDTGGVAWSPAPDGALPGENPPHVTVTVRVAKADDIDRVRLARLVEESVPAHVGHTIEVTSA